MAQSIRRRSQTNCHSKPILGKFYFRPLGPPPLFNDEIAQRSAVQVGNQISNAPHENEATQPQKAEPLFPLDPWAVKPPKTDKSQPKGQHQMAQSALPRPQPERGQSSSPSHNAPMEFGVIATMPPSNVARVRGCHDPETSGVKGTSLTEKESRGGGYRTHDTRVKSPLLYH
jgi:hypothetical protein